MLKADHYQNIKFEIQQTYKMSDNETATLIREKGRVAFHVDPNQYSTFNTAYKFFLIQQFNGSGIN
ncbi:MAG: hypothetical protein JHD28_11135, partial [Bacteroidia bacterium]|nr:hypothetical protein [Bacteroidia bacterium]